MKGIKREMKTKYDFDCEQHKDRGHRLQNDPQDDMPLKDRFHFLQRGHRDLHVPLEDRGHFFQDRQASH